MSELSPQTRDKLKTVSTATLTTALLEAGLSQSDDPGRRSPKRGAGTMVGEAYALR